jgi:hypothetical protein
VTSLPISNFQLNITGGFTIPGRLEKKHPEIRLVASSPGYLKAMHIPLLAGRDLASSDSPSSQLVGVVNHAFVEKWLPGVDPIGQQIVLDKDAEFPQPVTIVGVATDVVQQSSIGTSPQPEVYIPFQQLPISGALPQFMIAMAGSFAVRSASGRTVTVADIRNVIKSEAPGYAIDSLVPLSERVDGALKLRRLAVEITSIFAWVALLLSAAGLYGVLAYLVGQRVREIGIRLALGATRENVFALIVRQGLWMAGAGLLLGWLGAFFAGRWISSFLFGITARDPLTYVLAGAVIFLASAVAIALPARRAASVQPMEALRYE